VTRTPTAEPATLHERAQAWLVKEGYASPLPAGEYQLTDDGRDFMLWALWLMASCPGMPADLYDPSKKE